MSNATAIHIQVQCNRRKLTPVCRPAMQFEGPYGNQPARLQLSRSSRYMLAYRGHYPTGQLRGVRTPTPVVMMKKLVDPQIGHIFGHNSQQVNKVTLAAEVKTAKRLAVSLAAGPTPRMIELQDWNGEEKLRLHDRSTSSCRGRGRTAHRHNKESSADITVPEIEVTIRRLVVNKERMAQMRRLQRQIRYGHEVRDILNWETNRQRTPVATRGFRNSALLRNSAVDKENAGADIADNISFVGNLPIFTRKYL